MASFLDNKGDIILDAVLTDYGRRLLAKGDGSFNIVKFSFGDDEIDYGLFKSDVSPSQQDLDIISTPILEAFTNNAASMKSQLITMGDNKILFMPSLKLNQTLDNPSGSFGPNDSDIKFKGFVVPYNTTTNITTNELTGSVANRAVIAGVLSTGRFIQVDQGIDTNKLNKETPLDQQLTEDEFNIFVDDRFCKVALNYDNTNPISSLSVDDDGIAVYKVSNSDGFVTKIDTNQQSLPFSGPVGNRLQFTLIPSTNLSSDAYFAKYGKDLVLNKDNNTKTFQTIKMPLRVVGVKTGISIEVPIMFAKLK